MKVGLCVLTLNAGSSWWVWLDKLKSNIHAVDHVVVIDSSSDDNTAELAHEAGLEVIQIQRKDFGHGATRRLAASHMSDCDVIVYMTQDSFLADADSIAKLISAFDDPRVGACYGRQLPDFDAGPIGSHARIYNYGEMSYIRSSDDIKTYGMKTAFISNSFAAYRREALDDVGGFPSHIILGEDMVVAARMLLKMWKVAYVADAKVHHSHEYTLMQEFRRNFDIGVFHVSNGWLLSSFGIPEKIGASFVRSEIRYLSYNSPWLIPVAVVRNILKYTGYRLGRMERYLPVGIKRLLSMHAIYWDNESCNW